MDLLWGTDVHGRHEPPPLLALAVATDGSAVRVGPAVPEALAARLTVQVTGPGEEDLTRRPAELDRWVELLAPQGPTTVTGGPSYRVQSTPTHPGPFDVITSADPVPALLPAARPQAWWQVREWEDLLAGRLGPWAIAMEGPRVVALCHTPRADQQAAEAGVWTHPDDRRRGHAVAVTAAWAAVAGRDHRVLFYSTSEHNRASQGVARRMGLRPLGWIWQVRPRPDGPDGAPARAGGTPA